MKRGLALLIASLMIFTAASGSTISLKGEPTNPNKLSAKYRAVALPDVVKAKLSAKGMKISEHLPASLIKGPHAINPGNQVGVGPIASEQKAVALYLRFPENDAPPTKVGYEHIPVNLLQDLLFGDSYNPYAMDQFSQYATYNGIQAPTDRTLKNYYKGVSHGNVTVTGEVAEVVMPHGYSYYAIGQPYGVINENANGDYTMALIFKDAVMAADPSIDFSQYAVNGEVPNIFLIHEGSGAEFNTDPTVIWSHSWDYMDAAWYNYYAQTGVELPDYPEGKILVDGVYVNNYSIEPEVGGDITAYLGTIDGPYPPYVGVYAHEFGHVLGLPDQYDYGYDSEGTGVYTLMASGSWTRYPYAWQYAGNSPVYLDAWSQIFLGLGTPETLESGSKSYTLKPTADGGGIVKLIVPDSGGSEYFLVENRQQKGFDSAFGRYSTAIHGLAIYHVDENVLLRNFSRPNEAANWFQSRKQGVRPDPQTGETHYGISILQADNRWDLEKGNNIGDSGDLYKAGSSLTPTSTPNSGSYYFSFVNGKSLNNTGIFIKDIIENSDGTVTFTAGFEK